MQVEHMRDGFAKVHIGDGLVAHHFTIPDIGGAWLKWLTLLENAG